jgi:hypothetical protein
MPGAAREMNVSTRICVRLDPFTQSYEVRAVPVRMSIVCR